MSKHPVLLKRDKDDKYYCPVCNATAVDDTVLSEVPCKDE